MEERTKEIWDQIIHVHECTKHFALKAEESEKKFRTFIQPFNELKNALEHIIRAQSVYFGFASGKDNDYIIKNLNKALGHEYRAFFDTADWLSISLRDRIIDTLIPFHHEAISKAIPDYYSHIRPRIDVICNEIAGLREKKDIGNSISLMDEAEHYERILNELLEIDIKIRNSVSSIIEVDKARKNDGVKSFFSSTITKFLAGFVSALLLAVLLHFLNLKA